MTDRLQLLQYQLQNTSRYRTKSSSLPAYSGPLPKERQNNNSDSPPTLKAPTYSPPNTILLGEVRASSSVGSRPEVQETNWHPVGTRPGRP